MIKVKTNRINGFLVFFLLFPILVNAQSFYEVVICKDFFNKNRKNFDITFILNKNDTIHAYKNDSNKYYFLENEFLILDTIIFTKIQIIKDKFMYGFEIDHFNNMKEFCDKMNICIYKEFREWRYSYSCYHYSIVGFIDRKKRNKRCH